MRRPRHTWLVIASGEAQATFDDYADADAYARDTHPNEAPLILALPHWPTGMWRYGIETTTTTHHSASEPNDWITGGPVSPVIQAAHQHHTRTNRRCRGASIGILACSHTTPHYHCQRCGDRIL